MNMTLNDLSTAMTSYVAAAKQGGSWTASYNNFVGLLDKIGKQITIDGLVNDRLAGYFDAGELPLGKTIEEYFIEFSMSSAYTDAATDGADDLAPAVPGVRDVSYSYTLGRQYIKTTLLYGDYERACIGAAEAGNIGAKVLERLQNSYDLTKYAAKKQLLGNLIYKVDDEGQGWTSLAVPTDTESGEAAIEQIKKDVETASFANEGHCLDTGLIGAAPELVLFVKKGVMPNIAVKTLSGAFQKDELAIPAKVVVVDDFGSADSSVWGVLCDPRGLKIYEGYNATRSRENGQGDFVNIYKHFEWTCFISKYTFVEVYATPASDTPAETPDTPEETPSEE